MSNDSGRFGEDIAALFLMSKGCLIIERNYHSRYGEIDIIARSESAIGSAFGGVLIFAEVKTRSSMRFGAPSEYVDARKQAKCRLTAEHYLLERAAPDLQPRFDIIEVFTSTKPPSIRWLKDAF